VKPAVFGRVNAYLTRKYLRLGSTGGTKRWLVSRKKLFQIEDEIYEWRTAIGKPFYCGPSHGPLVGGIEFLPR
jgi:hypothetical protein